MLEVYAQVAIASFRADTWFDQEKAAALVLPVHHRCARYLGRILRRKAQDFRESERLRW